MGRQVRLGSIRQAGPGSVLLHPARICPSPHSLQVLDQAEELSILLPPRGCLAGSLSHP